MVKKRIFAWIAAFLLLMSCAVCLAEGDAITADEDTRVFDYARLFSQTEVEKLEKKIDQFQSRYDMDFAIVTNSASHQGTAEDFADAFYQENNLGYGSDKSGILLLYDLSLSDAYIYTKGKAIDYITDRRRDTFLPNFATFLRKAKKEDITFAKAFQEALSEISGYVEAGIPAGQYRYDVETGEILRQNGFTALEVVICAVISVGTGLVISLSTLSSYQLKGKTYSYDFMHNATVQVTHREDRFINTTHVRVPIPRGDSGGHGGHGGGGSGVHSSGGSSHGGGGIHV